LNVPMALAAWSTLYRIPFGSVPRRWHHFGREAWK
jgi:hypothetical protein